MRCNINYGHRKSYHVIENKCINLIYVRLVAKWCVAALFCCSSLPQLPSRPVPRHGSSSSGPRRIWWRSPRECGQELATGMYPGSKVRRCNYYSKSGIFWWSAGPPNWSADDAEKSCWSSVSALDFDEPDRTHALQLNTRSLRLQQSVRCGEQQNGNKMGGYCKVPLQDRVYAGNVESSCNLLSTWRDE